MLRDHLWIKLYVYTWWRYVKFKSKDSSFYQWRMTRNLAVPLKLLYYSVSIT